MDANNRLINPLTERCPVEGCSAFGKRVEMVANYPESVVESGDQAKECPAESITVQFECQMGHRIRRTIPFK
jgi:hypothetical protein